MTVEGIDISSNNNWRAIDTRGLSLCIVKLTQGMNYHWASDPEVIAWARTWATWVMGYHWLDPTVSAAAQATFFADAYGQLSLDGWWLDIEDPRRPVVPWLTLVPSVFDLVAARHDALRGGCYKGRYFAPELNGYCAAHNWWDPDYRGHPELSGGVLMHQYTSTGGPGGTPLDRNRVLDEPAFYRMVGRQLGPVTQPIAGENTMARMVAHSDGRKALITLNDIGDGTGNELIAQGCAPWDASPNGTPTVFKLSSPVSEIVATVKGDGIICRFKDGHFDVASVQHGSVR